jgi:hypothetical protein
MEYFRMTETLAQMEARHAAERDALEAALNVKAEPDWEAWRPAADAFFRAYCGHTDYAHGVFRDAAKALQAALPLAPAEPVDEVESVRQACIAYNLVMDAQKETERNQPAAMRAAIATLAHRGARWPGEAEMREIRDRLNAPCKCSGVDCCGYHRSNQFAEDTRRLRAHMTGDQA